MVNTTAIPIKASTQEHLSIEDIIDDIVILKDGACSLVVQVTAINFGLLSEAEQDAIIFAYAALLNSLTFPIQIIVRSIGKDISDYLRLVREQERKQHRPLLLNQLQKYRQFIEATVKDNRVLDKKFYVTIPFATLELGLTSTVASSFQKKKKLPYPKSYILEKAKMSLYPKRDHLVRQFGRLGLQVNQLTTKQLMELFYNLYNQEGIGQQFAPAKEYSNPIVQPAIGRPSVKESYSPPRAQVPSVPIAALPASPFPKPVIQPPNPTARPPQPPPAPRQNPPTTYATTDPSISRPISNFSSPQTVIPNPLTPPPPSLPPNQNQPTPFFRYDQVNKVR